MIMVTPSIEFCSKAMTSLSKRFQASLVTHRAEIISSSIVMIGFSMEFFRHKEEIFDPVWLESF